MNERTNLLLLFRMYLPKLFIILLFYCRNATLFIIKLVTRISVGIVCSIGNKQWLDSAQEVYFQMTDNFPQPISLFANKCQ